MSPDTLPKIVFFCFLIIVIFIGVSVCNSVKYEWMPEYEAKPKNQSTQDVSQIDANILKIKF